MKHKKETLKKASAEEVEALLRDGGLGGVIALDHKGRGQSSVQNAIE